MRWRESVGFTWASSFVTRGLPKPSAGRVCACALNIPRLQRGLVPGDSRLRMCVSVPRLRLAFRRQSRCAHARLQKAGASAKMAAKSFASRLRGSGRFLSVFVAGAVVGAAGGGFTAMKLLRSQGAEAALAVRETDGKSVGLLFLPWPRFRAGFLPPA